MTLANLIRANMEHLLSQWEDFASTRLPAAKNMSKRALRDHAEAILLAIAEDIEVPQSLEEQARRGRGLGEQRGMDVPGETHGTLRVEEGFSIEQLVSEYRALRSSVLSRWESSLPTLDRAEHGEVTRFNEAIDQALAASMNRFSRKLESYRDLFLAILGHDLRNPIGAIHMSAVQLSRSEDPAVSRSGQRILNSTRRMNRMVGDLLDLTRTRLGAGIPIARAPTDLAAVCREVLEEAQAQHPTRTLHLEAPGSLEGDWDSGRMAQVVSNLVMNAIQHGREDTPVTLQVQDEGLDVVLAVHNEGPPIPEPELDSIFEPLVRKTTSDADKKMASSLGLGLFVVRQIVAAHNGDVRVTSSVEQGTTFEVRLPRRPPAHEQPAPLAPPDAHAS